MRLAAGGWRAGHEHLRPSHRGRAVARSIADPAWAPTKIAQTIGGNDETISPSARPSQERIALLHAVVGLLTPRLDETRLLAACKPCRGFEPSQGSDWLLKRPVQRQWLKMRSSNRAWSQRRGRPGIAPEFPVASAERHVPSRPPTHGEPNSRDRV
ncbi:hypothetical protein PLANPX_5775 [Lacipirellula parvula]|uniref:Uncharacterized protein n=1 Tax=Lacipirellula parvula TaxID=2650471 RepID=A0A5K7XN24_9BACT|nr:hypothetical protein PLANPX_5775 [Lacipirellula parvula]